METIYTIPLNEAFAVVDGCPFCRIREKLEHDSLEYTLGAAMMEPDVRTNMNKLGFCHEHFVKLAASKNKLALALILESHLDTVLNTPESLTGPIEDGSCFVCNRVESTMERYLKNAAYIYVSAPAFRDNLMKQEYFCKHHYYHLLRYAKRVLNRKQFTQFYNDVKSIQTRYLLTIKADARKFADSFDYRNSGKELGDEKKVFEKASKLM